MTAQEGLIIKATGNPLARLRLEGADSFRLQHQKNFLHLCILG